jgi:NTE family protein
MKDANSAPLPGQIVAVFQGGGALGAYQAGVYQALHESGIEPDWIVGTSIGAINACLIAGNEPARRVPALREFWRLMTDNSFWHTSAGWSGPPRPCLTCGRSGAEFPAFSSRICRHFGVRACR